MQQWRRMRADCLTLGIDALVLWAGDFASVKHSQIAPGTKSGDINVKGILHQCAIGT